MVHFSLVLSLDLSPPHSFPTSTSQPQTPRADNTREPIDYFSEYFGWETWLEIASSTIKLSNKPNAVTAKEVAQFVGIHIAMGTLKVCAPFFILNIYCVLI